MQLTIRRDRLEFIFELGEGARLVRGLTRVEERSLRNSEQRLVHKLRRSPWGIPERADESFQEMGSYLGTILPEGVRKALSEAAQVQLTCQDDPQLTPWEHAWVNGHALWQTLSMGRVLEGARRGKVLDDPPSVLLVCDPDGLVPGASLEARVVQACLGGFVERLPGAGLERALRTGYGVLHLSAYAVGDSLCLADGLWNPSALVSPCKVPRLVFLNLHEAEADPHEPLLARSQRWARLFSESGVETVVVTAWDIDPQWSASLAAAFYNQLDAGRTVGQALRSARLREGAGSDPWLSAHAYQAFGNLDLTWSDLRPMLVASNRSQITVSDRWVADLVLEVTAGPETKRQIPLFLKALAGQSLVLGSPGARPCDIELEDPELENQAARLSLEGERLWLTRLCPQAEGLRVNGLPVTDKICLEGSEELQMGSSTIQLRRLPGRRAARSTPEAARYALEMVGESGRFVLSQPVELVGRISDCSVQLDDPAVSRRHATVTWRERAYHVGPVGGSLVAVNGVPIDSERALKHQDQVQLSDTTVLRFVDLHKDGS